VPVYEDGLSIKTFKAPSTASSNERIKIELRLENHNDYVYDGNDTVDVIFNQDGKVVKRLNTNWALSKIKAESTKYFSYMTYAGEEGTYTIEVQLSDNSDPILVHQYDVK